MKYTAEEYDEELSRLRAKRSRTENEILRIVAEICDRPHVPVQHRDRLPPWCDVCGRGTLGIVYREEKSRD